MSDELFRNATWLISAIERALSARRGEEANVEQILVRLACQDIDPTAFRRQEPRTLPACSFLAETVGEFDHRRQRRCRGAGCR